MVETSYQSHHFLNAMNARNNVYVDQCLRNSHFHSNPRSCALEPTFLKTMANAILKNESMQNQRNLQTSRVAEGTKVGSWGINSSQIYNSDD